MKKVFISFADKRLHRAAKRIFQQATEMGVYDRVIVSDEKDLDSSFVETYRSRMVPGSRGFGYWCWKPQIVLQTLRDMDPGDILQWTDVGCHLNPSGRNRLLEYFRTASDCNGDILAFQGRAPELPFDYDGRPLPDISEHIWTKGDLLDHFGVRSDTGISMSPQIGTTTFFVKKSPASLALIQKWQDTYSAGFYYADDSPSTSPNLAGFIEHRHDQSIFSLVCKTNGVKSISAFEYWYPKVCAPGTDIVSMLPDWEALRDYPIHAKRDKDLGILNKVKVGIKTILIRAGVPTRSKAIKRHPSRS